MGSKAKCARCGQEVTILNSALMCLVCEATVAQGYPKLVDPPTPVIPLMRVTAPTETPAVQVIPLAPGVTMLPPLPGLGRKDDQGKRDWTLLPLGALEEVVKALEHGEREYGRDNWQKVEGGRARYLKAGWRHLVARTLGEERDQKSGCLHLAHLVCCCLFLMSKPFNTSETGGPV